VPRRARGQGRPLTARQGALIVTNATVLVLAYGAVVLGGARSNVQGALERAAYGSIALFVVAIVVQLLVLIWLDRRA
jgi:hypothetical protein